MKPLKSVLKNGLTVLTVPLRSSSAASVGIWVKIGGRHESERLNGVSHFVEHLLFKGTRRRSMRRIKEEVEGRGGVLNAFTGEEFTCYHAKIPDRHFFSTLDVLADMVENAVMHPEDVKKERTVIIEEIKMVQDQPAQHVEEVLDEMVWKGHSLGRPLAGTVESVRRMDRKDLLAYRDDFYVPALMTVVSAGAVPHRDVVRWLERRFRRPRQPARYHSSGPPRPPIRGFRLITKKTEQAHLAMAVPALRQDHPDRYALSLLNIILGGNMSSRLFNEVREEKGLAYEIASGTKRLKDTGVLGIYAGVDASKIEEAVTGIMKVCSRLARRPAGRDELKRAREFYIGQFLIGMDTSMDLMLWAGEEHLASGRVRELPEIEREVHRVTAGDIRALAARLFTGGGMNCALLGPVPAAKRERLDRLLRFD